MPTYVLFCTECNLPLKGEVTCSMQDRDELHCTNCGCFGSLINDYDRMDSTSFQLNGKGWPGKDGRLASKIMKEGV